jgi:hypothetical protein
MSRHTEVSGLDADIPARGSHPDVEQTAAGPEPAGPRPAAPRRQFGRLTLWMASASALTAGVMGTVAYGAWFGDDQRAYAEAVSSARMALRSVGPPSPMQSSVQYGRVTPASPPAVEIAGTDPAATDAAAAPAQRREPAPDAAAPQRAAAHPERANCPIPPPPRRHPPVRPKPSGGAFGGVSAFFRRTSYPQHGPGRERDIYARP